MDVIPRLQPGPARLRDDQVVPLGDADVDRVLAVGVTRVPLGQERMARERPGHRLVHERMQQPEHHRVSDIRPQERRIRVPMDRAVEELGCLRITRQPLRDRLGPEIEAAPGCVRPAVQERHRGHVNLLRHLEGHGLARLQRHLDRLARRVPRRHDVHRMRHRVMDLHHQLAETAVHSVPHRLDRPDIRNGAAPDRLPGPGIMIRGTDRLDEQGPEAAVRPGRGPEGVVVPEHRADIHVSPEPLPDELHGHDVVRRMIVFQRLVEGDRVALDLLDSAHLVPLHVIGPHQQLGIHVILRRILHRDAGGAFLDGRGQRRVHRRRQPLVRLLGQHRERPHRLLVGHAGDHAVRGLVVELDEVEMGVDLGGLEVRVVVVFPFAGENPIHAIIDIRADHERILQVILRPNRGFFLMEHIDQAGLVHDRRFFPLLLGHRDRQLDKVDVVKLPPRVLWTQAPTSIFTGLRRFSGPLPVLLLVDHLQPGRAVVIRREHDPFPEVRPQMRPGHLAGRGLEQDCLPLARRRGLVLGIVNRALFLSHRPMALPDPVQDGGIVGHDLALLIVLVSGLPLGRELHLHPVLNRDHHRVRLPVGLSLLNDLEGLPEPVHRLPDELIGGDADFHAAFPVRELPHVRHDVVSIVADLEGVVDPPVAPHP